MYVWNEFRFFVLFNTAKQGEYGTLYEVNIPFFADERKLRRGKPGKKGAILLRMWRVYKTQAYFKNFNGWLI